jgi:hypothetical protein
VAWGTAADHAIILARSSAEDAPVVAAGIVVIPVAFVIPLAAPARASAEVLLLPAVSILRGLPVVVCGALATAAPVRRLRAL